ncbi:MAG: phospholipid carrier-dependent glycosyltransferase [Lachnospiraceae bacterium]|nr:phospholipid carrier-dependent glycosyltransferase [Lachnospiraceae bacterium]
MNKKDAIWLGILLTVFASLAFFRLGNNFAPQSAYRVTSENRDIVLDFGDYLDIGSISVFLGSLNTRHFSISVFNEVTGRWEVIDGEAAAESVFSWNRIDINYNVRYVGLVSTDDEAVFNEFVVQRTDGAVILPVNAQDYPELFDEQEMFPEAKTYMDGTMFDEVYHGRTAFEFIHSLPTYETTHPHLGKILISLGIRLFGMTPFGWRFMSVLFGILILAVMYLFAKKLFGSTFIAAASTSLLAFDCMHYTLSRIATIDIFAAFFILLMYYFLYEYFCRDSALKHSAKCEPPSQLSVDVLAPLGLCGLSMAFGIATKWTGVYAGAGLGILFFWYTLTHFSKKQTARLFGFCCVFFIAVPLVVYTLSFLPVVGHTPYKGLIDKAVRGSISMFEYHSKLVAEHYYSSPFYEWPVVWMPLLDANDAVSDTLVSSVSCMGNPAIWWAGIPCSLFVLYRWLGKRDQKAGFLFLSYAAQYVPWMSIGRITFIYHYFPAILFVMLMMGYTMDYAVGRFRYGKKAVILYLITAILVFALFFPVISGLPVSKQWGLHLRWLKDWILVL